MRTDLSHFSVIRGVRSAINPKQREFYDSYRGFIIDKFLYCQTPKENVYRQIDAMLDEREERAKQMEYENVKNEIG